MTLYLKICIAIACSSVFLKLLRLAYLDRSKTFSLPYKLKLIFTGFVSNILDTLGVGSFAIIVAFNKFWDLLDDRKLPGTLNAQGMLPSMLQAIIFLQIVRIEMWTLGTLVFGTCLGGLIGGFTVSKLDKQTIRISMVACYLSMAVLVLTNQLGLLDIGGEAIELRGSPLVLAFLAMVGSGILPAFGVGFYAPVQLVLFLVGLSPLVAFPIMTTAGALQQPVTSYTLILKNLIDYKATVLLSISGVFAVLLIAPFISSFEPEKLRWILFVVVLYNAQRIYKTYKEEKTSLA